MTWANRYLPPTEAPWQGRMDSPAASSFFQIIKLLDLKKNIPDHTKLAFALLGFRCDEGIRRNLGRIGAAEGPIILREVLAKLPVHRQEIICYDAGDITCVDNNLESSQQSLGEAVSLLLQHNIIPIVLGGGHEMAWGHFQGIGKHLTNAHLAIVNFDAHFDMRPLLADKKGSSGTPFLQIAEAQEAAHRRFNYYCIGIQQAGNIQALFDTAKKCHAQYITADELQIDTQKGIEFIQTILQNHRHIYLSLCLDVFASAFAPGVSAPQALGLSPWQLMPLVRKLASSGKVMSYDLAELSPKYDIDLRTTKLAANLIYEMIHHHKT